MKNTIDNPRTIGNISYYKPKTFKGFVKDEHGSIAYYENGRRHRTDGPAIIWFNGRKDWYIHGEWHREDGPAIEFANGEKGWYYNGRCYGFNNDFTIESWTNKWKLEIFK